MPRLLRAKQRQRRGNPPENTFNVDVDHALPIVNREVIELADRHHAGIINEHVESPESFLCARYQHRQTLASRLCLRSWPFLRNQPSFLPDQLTGGFQELPARSMLLERD